MSYAGIFTDKNNIDHPITSTLYGTCSTAAATAAKEVVCSNVDSLEAGMTLRVVFTNANTAASPTINVNSKGAKNVYRFGSTTPIGGNSWEAGAVVDLFYDGTSFFMLNSDNLGTAAAKAATNAVTENSTDLVESGAVYTGLATKADLTDLAPAFSTSTAYTVGQYVSYDGNLYKCTSAHSAGAWVAGDFTLVAVGSELSAINSNLSNKQNATDNNLQTTDKTVVGGINELKSGLTNLDNEVNGDATTYPYADVITIPDAIPANVADCTVKIESVQDLHGYDHPWVGGAGKNKLPLVLADIKAANTYGTWSGNVYTENSVKYTVLLDNDGNVIGVNIDGVAPTATGMILATNQTFDTDCLLSKGDSRGVGVVYLALLNNAGTGVAVEATSIGATVEAGNYGNVRIRVNANITVSNVNIYPMIRLATETDATFAPYTNYCPITGHTEASVTVVDDAENPTVTKTYTIAIGDTIYGGTVDFNSGVMTVDRAVVDLGTLNYTYNATDKWYNSPISNMKLGEVRTLTMLCECYQCIDDGRPFVEVPDSAVWNGGNSGNVYIRDTRYTDPSDLTTALDGIKLVYPIATPFTVQLTPQQIQLLKGTNTLTASTGDISVTVNGVSGAIGSVQEQVNDIAEDVADVQSSLAKLHYHKVAESAATGTRADKLASLYTTYNTLPNDVRKSAILLRNNADICHAVNNGGAFSSVYLDANSLVIIGISLNPGSFVVNSNGNTTDGSSTENTEVYSLWIIE